MSPEILKYEGYNNKSDIWSIGIILYELCTQRRAFTGTNLMRVMWQVINDPCPQLPEIYSKELQEVLELMLKKVPQERPSASELLQLNIIHSYLRVGAIQGDHIQMKSETSDECVVDRDANPRFISFEEFINSPDLILQEQKLLQYNENLSEEADDMTEKNTENVDQYLTPRQKIKVNKATESDWTIATLRNLAEQLICSRNSLNSTKGTDLYTWQKRYPSSNHLWPTVQTSTERMLNDLRNLYVEKINEDYGITEETDNFEYTENLLWPHRPLLEGNNIPAGKGPGAEDESLGFFYSTDFVKQINNTHGQIKEQKDFMNFTAMRKFSTSCGPVYERQCIDKLTKQESITNEDNNNNVNEKEHEKITQQNLFIRRSFTIPEVASSNYNQSAGQLNKINTSRLKCNDVFSENTQLLETCYTNYDDELMNYSQRSIQENLSNSVENEKNNVEDDLEDIENQDNENTCETLDDVLCYMKAALRQSEDSNTIIMDSEAGSKYGPEAKAKKIETLRNYCIEKLGIQRFQNAYNYLYQKRITENNQSGELTILDGLKDYCSDVTTGFLLDHLIFLENDTKQTISIQPPNSVNQVLESSLQFCM
ncbi:unnamed protein product [Heterobilharzia americana]|nr:unnamed protein product [Heterobilharzia americana]